MLAPARPSGVSNRITRPHFVTPNGAVEARSPVDFVRDNRTHLSAALRTSGALVLRDFALHDAEPFRAVAYLLGGPLGQGYAGPSMRSELGKGVYTASEVPAPYVIHEHAELSYEPTMPRHLFFWCRRAAREGGETTLVDGRAVRGALDPARIAPLLAGDLRIRRRHAPARLRLDPFEHKPWTVTFGTTRREEALARAEALGFTARFLATGALELVSRQPALRRHPETGELAWLNHLLVFHGTATEALLESARALLPSAGLRAGQIAARAYRTLAPHIGFSIASDVTLHDGSAIPADVLAHVREVVAEARYAHAWRRGDLVVVDNHAVMHGRLPYRGERSVALAWSRAEA